MDDDDLRLTELAGTAGAHALTLYLITLAALLLATALAGRFLLRHPRAATPAPQPQPLSPIGLVVRLLLGFGLIVAAGGLFAEIADELRTEQALGLADEAFITAMIGRVPEAALQAFYALTFLGNRTTLTALAVIVAVALWRRRRRGLALGWTLAMIGNGLLNPTLKQLFERARPIHPTPYLTEDGFSFPSGHSSGSVVAFGMLAYVATRVLPVRWHLAVWLAAVGLAFSVGSSRIFLRVHFPSDVLAGFASGTAWLVVCITSIELARWVRRRRRPAPP